MKTFILSIILAVTFKVSVATTYYVDSRAATNGTGLSNSSPFQSYSSVALANGDSVLFACGSSYTQSIIISTTNVTLGSYGTGAKPLFSNSANWYVFLVSGTGITIDGLQFGVSTYSGIELTGSGNTILNCLFSAMPKGVAVSGSNNYIHHNTFRDGIMQPGKNGTNDDVGALGICLNSGANTTEIAYNSFLHCKAPSPDYGEDGGAVEIYGNVNGIRIHHNYAEDCCGLFEFGGGAIQNIEIYRNLFRNNYGLGGIHTSGSFAATITNINYVHNTMYDLSGGSEVFWVFGTAGQSEVKLKNNLFYFSGFQKFTSASGIIHQNNIYYSPSGNPLGISKDVSEMTGVDPNFISAMDYHLTSSSVAVNYGQATSYTTDYDGLPTVANPDAGTYEFQPVAGNDLTPPSTPSQLAASGITSNGFFLSWSASTDNVGVTGYDILKNGVYMASSTSTSISITGLNALTSYSMTVMAKDGAGNTSPQSQVLNVTTTTPPNLLLNPGFESGTSSWTGSGASIATTTTKYAGSFGLSTTARTTASSGPQQTITNAVASNGSGNYYAEAYVKMSSGSASVRIAIKYTIGGVTYFAKTPGVSVGKSAFKKVSGILNLNYTGTLQNAVLYIETTSGTTGFFTDECWLNKGTTKSGSLKIEGSESKIEFAVSIYPNPVLDEIVNIELPADEDFDKVTIRLFDLNGKIVETRTSENRRIVQLSTGKLPIGTYLITVTGSLNKTISRKIIIP